MPRDSTKAFGLSGDIHWNTPAWYVEVVRRISPIALDPCSNARSVVRALVNLEGLSHEDDGLLVDWAEIVEGLGGGLVYVNPPYGDALPAWMGKSIEQAAKGLEIVALVPSRTDTAWMHHQVFGRAQGICFFEGRIQFDGQRKTAAAGSTIPNAAAYWGPSFAGFQMAHRAHGRVFALPHPSAIPLERRRALA